MVKRTSFGIALFDNNYNLLIIHEKSYPIRMRKWGVPKGRKEPRDETIFATKKRELLEEVRINIDNTKYKEITYATHCHVSLSIIVISSQITPSISLTNEILEAKWINFHDLISLYNSNENMYNSSIKALMKKKDKILKLLKDDHNPGILHIVKKDMPLRDKTNIVTYNNRENDYVYILQYQQYNKETKKVWRVKKVS